MQWDTFTLVTDLCFSQRSSCLKKYACFAGGVGAGLADIYGGMRWAPWTLVIKIIMVLIVQLFFDLLIKRATNGGHVAKVAGLPFQNYSHTCLQFSGLYLVTTQRRASYMETGLPTR